MSLQMSPSVLPSFSHRLVHGHFVIPFIHETPTYCSWELWKIVLILFCVFVLYGFFVFFLFFSATKLLHKVCLKTNIEYYLGYKERNTVIIQSIVLVFGGTKGLVMTNWDNLTKTRIRFVLQWRASLIVYDYLLASVHPIPKLDNRHRVQISKASHNPWCSPCCSYVNISKRILCILKSEVE